MICRGTFASTVPACHNTAWRELPVPGRADRARWIVWFSLYRCRAPDASVTDTFVSISHPCRKLENISRLSGGAVFPYTASLCRPGIAHPSASHSQLISSQGYSDNGKVNLVVQKIWIVLGCCSDALPHWGEKSPDRDIGAGRALILERSANTIQGPESEG